MLSKRRKISADTAKDPALAAVAERYAVALTDHVAALAETSDAVARQYLPDARELETTPGELADPIGDDTHSPVKGIVHRYPDRVLLKPVEVCAVYCRFCFRREKVGPGGEALDDTELNAALDYIRSAPQVWEVILTGGDPFVLSPRRLQNIMQALDDIAHVKVVRFHTRVPAAAPTRVTAALVDVLKASRKAVYVVIHCNHPDEFTPEMDAACDRLRMAGIPLLSQSALLRGINDHPDTLEKLFRGFVERRIKPYYLHHPDMAQGTSHFRLPLKNGRALLASLWGRLSGIAQPSYMIDIPGGHGKVNAHSHRVICHDDGTYDLTDFKGKAHTYHDE